MGNIVKHDGKNLGGVNRLEWIYQEDLLGITFPGTGLYCQVTLKPGRQWNTLYGTPETIQMESEQQDTPAGMKYGYKVRALVPKDRQAIESQLFTMTTRRIILKVTDKNSVVRYIGTMETPVKLSCKLVKPATLEAFNGYELTFSGEFSSPAGYQIPSSGIPDGGDID